MSKLSVPFSKISMTQHFFEKIYLKWQLYSFSKISFRKFHSTPLFCKSHITIGWSYRVFPRFGQAKFPYGSSVLGSSQFSILPQLPPKILLNSKVVKIDPKIIISLCLSKSVTHFVAGKIGKNNSLITDDFIET